MFQLLKGLMLPPKSLHGNGAINPCSSRAYSVWPTSQRGLALRSFGTYKSGPETTKQKRQRPMVHLSSAIGEKYKAKSIGTPHPIVPHTVTPRRSIPEHLSISMPSYAKTGKVPDLDIDMLNGNVAIHKDEHSIQGMKKACQLAAQMLELASSMAKTGVYYDSNDDRKYSIITTDDIDRVIHEQIIQAGGYPSPLNYQSFPKSICTSVNEVACHGIPDTRMLEVGDGFHGDNCTTVVVGGTRAHEYMDANDAALEESIMKSENIGNFSQSPCDLEERSERAKALMDATELAMMSAISICQANTPICEIGNMVQEIADNHGYRIMKKVHGHGIGENLHMLPAIKHYRNKDIMVLEAGMAITIEPLLVEGHGAHIVFEDGWQVVTVDGGLAAQFEHTILITESGKPEILTASPKEPLSSHPTSS